MVACPVGIVWGAGPAEKGAGRDQGKNRHYHHSHGFTLDVRNGIQRNLPAGKRGVIAADLGGQRMRRFVTSGGEKKGHIPDKSQGNEFRLDIGHEVTLSFLRACSVVGPAPLCKSRTRYIERRGFPLGRAPKWRDFQWVWK